MEFQLEMKIFLLKHMIKFGLKYHLEQITRNGCLRIFIKGIKCLVDMMMINYIMMKTKNIKHL